MYVLPNSPLSSSSLLFFFFWAVYRRVAEVSLFVYFDSIQFLVGHVELFFSSSLVPCNTSCCARQGAPLGTPPQGMQGPVKHVHFPSLYIPHGDACLTQVSGTRDRNSLTRQLCPKKDWAITARFTGHLARWGKVCNVFSGN